MTYLLDTCALSDFARGEAGTLGRLREVAPSEVTISAISAMEVEYGLALDPVRARKLAPVMRALLEAVRILPYGLEDARATTSLRASLEMRGRPVGAYDALIAGTAIARGLVLVTSNVREFGRIAVLRVENWRSARSG
jgi:tRNA(fMet)-specific endonuclease VapC